MPSNFHAFCMNSFDNKINKQQLSLSLSLHSLEILQLWIHLETCASKKSTVHNLNVVCKPLSPMERGNRIYMIMYMWLCISVYLYKYIFIYT